ncbi:MAG: hypothetical protein Q8R58_00095 [Sulfuricurvum sp.]|jgi:hypothetical protein|nr:hypothetical protein [Sulfuricurvum sp.]
MTKRKMLSIELSSEEYGELLAKLANELEIYDDEASDWLKSAYISLIRADLFNDYYETTLIKKWKERLFDHIPE